MATDMEQAKSEVLRYLGHRNQEVPEALDKIICECLALMRTTAEPRQVSRQFDLVPREDGIALTGTGLVLRGEDIARLLRGCPHAVLLAATLGAGADALIRKWERTDITRSLILDACATQLIEEFCDETEERLRAEAADLGFMAARRFSPGYGDLPLDIQPQILDVLDAGRKTGLTCTESLILLPRKSVTAVIGLGKSISMPPDGCGGCAMRDKCNFRKDGNEYGCPGMDKK